MIKKDTGLIAVFIFYNIASGVQAGLAFSDEFKHCNIITFDGKDWIMLDFDRTGLLTRKIYTKDGVSLLNKLPLIPEVTAIVSVSIKERAKTRWKPWWVRSCNEVCRYAAGIDLGFTFNPIHLYYKLLKYKRRRNYEMLSHWRRRHGIFRGRQRHRADPSGAASGRAASNEQGRVGEQEAKSLSDTP